MPPKSKSDMQDWSKCLICHTHLPNSILHVHETTCNAKLDYNWWLEETDACRILQHLSNTKKECTSGFVRDQVFFTQVNITSVADWKSKFIHWHASNEKNIVFVPIAIMKMCKMVTGDLICITRKNSEQMLRCVWPMKASGSFTLSVFELLHKQLGLDAGEWLCVTAFSGCSRLYAKEITLELRHGENNCLDSFLIKRLHHQEVGYYFTSGSQINFNCLGMPCAIKVVKILGVDGNTLSVDELDADSNVQCNVQPQCRDLEKTFENLNLNYSTGDMKNLDRSLSNVYHSTPVKSELAVNVSVVETPRIQLKKSKFYRWSLTTQVIVQNQANAIEERISKSLATFDDIGGINKEIEQLRFLVRTSLHDSQQFMKGVKKSNCVLFYGLPGTGKTMTAEAVISENNCNFVVIDSSDIFKSYYGESEACLRKIFENAIRKSPSIILIRSIHTFSSRSQSDQESRIIHSLSKLLDDISSKESTVFVIATTNEPDRVPSKLRGRLAKEIEFSVPTTSQRYNILMKILSKGQHTLSNDEIKSVADCTHGFVGADLRLLYQTAAIRALNLQIPSCIKPEHIQEEDKRLSQVVAVTLSDMLYACGTVKPSGLRDHIVEVPKVYWNDIGGQADFKRDLQEIIDWTRELPEAFEQSDLKPSFGVLMYGPPGCSKTLIAKALATEGGINFVSVKGSEIFSKWVGESEKAIRNLYRKARASAPCIIFFDEFDTLAPERQGSAGGSNVGNRVLTQLLMEMDGISENRNVITIAATNRPDLIDSALLRPGRLGHLVYVPLPSSAARKEILEIKLRKVALADDVDLNELVERTSGYSGAEVTAVCQRALCAAVREGFKDKQLQMKHFFEALKEVKPRTDKEMIKFCETFRLK